MTCVTNQCRIIFCESEQTGVIFERPVPRSQEPFGVLIGTVSVTMPY